MSAQLIRKIFEVVFCGGVRQTGTRQSAYCVVEMHFEAMKRKSCGARDVYVPTSGKVDATSIELVI